MTIETPSQESQPLDARADRERVKAVMRDAGLLVEPQPASPVLAAEVRLTLDQAAEILGRGDGPPFSQQVDEERGARR
jgi:hypothetical protein